MLYHINFKTFEEFLRELEHAQTGRQTERQTERWTYRIHKQFLVLLESVKKKRKKKEEGKAFQMFILFPYFKV